MVGILDGTIVFASDDDGGTRVVDGAGCSAGADDDDGGATGTEDDGANVVTMRLLQKRVRSKKEILHNHCKNPVS